MKNKREENISAWYYYCKNNSIFARDRNYNNRKESKEIRKENTRVTINILEKLQVDFQEEE